MISQEYRYFIHIFSWKYFQKVSFSLSYNSYSLFLFIIYMEIIIDN